MKIAILIPTLNEEKTVQFVTKRIDDSLCKYFKSYDNYIINCDSDSSDDTRKNFLNCETKTKKILINTHKKGKGNNIKTFFQYCIENKIDYAATIDADIESIDDEWVKKLIMPLINGANYVVPFYKRGKYDGNLTNQFVFPIICLFSNNYIRQPIGGEFGFDRKFINTFINTKFYGTDGFGIDICMTLCAVANNLKIDVANLEQKKHKPGVNNMKKMIREVSEVLFTNLKMLNLKYNNNSELFFHEIDYSFFNEDFIKKDRGIDMVNKSLEELKKDKYRNLFDKFNLPNSRYISSENWCAFLGYFLTLKHYTLDEFDFFTEIAIIRTVNYWNEIEEKNLIESENILFDYVLKLQKYLKNIKGDEFNE